MLHGQGHDGVVRLQLALHDAPEIFNRVKVWRIAQPIHRGEILGGEEGRDTLCLVAGGPILQKLSDMVEAHVEEYDCTC